MDFQLTIDWILEQPIELVRQQSQPSQKASNPFKKPLSVKQSIETIKQLVVFPLLYKTIFFKKVLIPNCFRFKQRVDYTLIYPDPTHTSNNFCLPSNTTNLETSKLQDHPWSTKNTPACIGQLEWRKLHWPSRRVTEANIADLVDVKGDAIPSLRLMQKY